MAHGVSLCVGFGVTSLIVFTNVSLFVCLFVCLSVRCFFLFFFLFFLFVLGSSEVYVRIESDQGSYLSHSVPKQTAPSWNEDIIM